MNTTTRVLLALCLCATAVPSALAQDTGDSAGSMTAPLGDSAGDLMGADTVGFTEAPLPPAPVTPEPEEDGTDWGWLGLAGLAGLAGLRKRHDDHDRSAGGR